jgi:hypothetical protein
MANLCRHHHYHSLLAHLNLVPSEQHQSHWCSHVQPLPRFSGFAMLFYYWYHICKWPRLCLSPNELQWVILIKWPAPCCAILHHLPTTGIHHHRSKQCGFISPHPRLLQPRCSDEMLTWLQHSKTGSPVRDFSGSQVMGGPFPWTAAACSRTESVNSPRASNNVTLPASGCPSGFEKGAVAPTKALVLHDKPCFFLVVPPKFSYKLNSNHPSSEEPAIKSTASISRNIPPDSRRKALSQQCTKTLSAEHMTQNLPLKTIFGLLQIPLNPSKPSKPPAAKLQPNLPRGRL